MVARREMSLKRDRTEQPEAGLDGIGENAAKAEDIHLGDV